VFNGRNRRANGKPRQWECDKSSRTRAAILAAAMDEFSQQGFGAARVDRIAKAAKLNNHALYYLRVAARQLVDDIAFVLRRGHAARRFAGAIGAEHVYFSIFALCSFYFTNA